MGRSKYEYVSFRNHICYSVLEAYSRLTFRFFFKSLEFKGRSEIPKNDPVIFVANHQSAFIDPLIISNFIYRRPWFLTRAGVFNTAFARWVFRNLHMLPIFRQRDKVNVAKANQATFDFSVKVLLKNGALVIFPEGNHGMRKFLRTPLKKGFARLAFEAMSASGGSLNLKIVPVGIYLEDPTRARTRCLVNYGKAFPVKDFLVDYEKHPQEGMRKLIEKAESALSEVMIDFGGEEDYEQKEILWQQERPRNVPLKKHFNADKAWINKNSTAEVKAYQNPKRQLGFDLVFGFPLFLVGILWNLPLLLIARFAIKPLLKDPHFYQSIFYAVGTFLTPLLSFLQAIILYLILGDVYWAIGVFILGPIAGIFSYDYYGKYIRKAAWINTTRLKKGFGG